ncbi:MAG: hypothetical protein HYW91_01775, partial [Candidatus Sungbacteria bacterium]|nr:hypothetical protein [Candidatus Sungbacteria bacterium]
MTKPSGEARLLLRRTDRGNGGATVLLAADFAVGMTTCTLPARLPMGWAQAGDLAIHAHGSPVPPRGGLFS